MSLITSPDRATYATILDDFEDNDIAEYGVDTAQFTTVATPTQNGSYALEATSSGSPYNISSTTGLDNYPSQGDSWRVWFRTGGATGDIVGGTWATSSEAAGFDFYSVILNKGAGDLNINKRVGGTFTNLATATQTYADNTWYETQIDWTTSGGITATLYDGNGTQLNQISATDTEFTSGGIGWQVNSSTTTQSTVHYDFSRII